VSDVAKSQRLKLPYLSTKTKWLVMHMHVQLKAFMSVLSD
jgi:hypothetical protein